jgi:hypothetical protein
MWEVYEGCATDNGVIAEERQDFRGKVLDFEKRLV